MTAVTGEWQDQRERQGQEQDQRERQGPEQGRRQGPEQGRRRERRGPERERRPGRLCRTALAALLAAAVVLPLSAAARPGIPAPPPAVLPARLTPAALATVYEANRENAAEAARMAAADGDLSRASADRALASPSRRLLHLDARGTGQVTEVFGDLAHATRIAVLVPGSDTTLDTYARFHTAAESLYRRVTREAPGGTRTAVVAWLGYRTPATISTAVLSPGRAGQAAPRLRAFIGELRGLTTPGPASVALLCHSYGTVVCARAAPAVTGLGVTDIALVGSPGTGAGSAAALHTSARVWAARGAADWIAEVPHVHADLFGTTVGFGTDPVSPSFGARVFAAGPGGHSGYFTPGSASLANLARIVLGETTEVTRA
ncbi:alpha/beta hydrolase [Streptomyces sp. Ag109_O5-10]|uniref:alpha/beta hydrolase n=1 Tax=Streptomyces sp. Ag109_O5-10 TaxID=1855349 RepID=UPI0008949340|nr:alpha/beta hydrolase [Streptomyces sp. Ag109_O5-10]SEE85081.1 Alpha/beta hydrolase [Streptomyces sp. Ag109_O5-10]